MASFDDSLVFLGVSPCFDLVLEAITELRETQRLDLVHQQSAEKVNFASRSPDGFGGSRSGRKRALDSFARAFQVVARRCMKVATGMMKTPTDVQFNNITEPGAPFRLSADSEIRLHYTSLYDVMNNVSLTKDKMRNDGNLSSMMIIFRNDYRQLVVINTTARAEQDPEYYKRFDNRIFVLCMVFNVRPLGTNEVEGDIMTQLRQLNAERQTQESMTQSLVDTLANLQL